MTRPDPDPLNLLASRPSLRMDAQAGLLFEDVPLHLVARTLGTPCWVTGAGTLRRRTRNLKTAFVEAGLDVAIHYALKANDHLATLTVLREEGCGADVVSGGELRRAIHAGFAPEDIVFSGVGKTRAEMALALHLGVGQINVESAEELHRLSQVAAGADQTARVALRVNPDIDAGTHDKISTGRAGDKFGIAWDQAATLYAEAAALPGLEPVGLAVHIGSQILSPAPFRAAFARVAALVRQLRAEGMTVRAVDCGGGLGIRYRDEIAPPPAALAGAIKETLGALDVALAVEPGRWIAAPAGVLLSSVIDMKRTPDGAPDFLILDAAMNDLARPALYESWHGILPLSPERLHVDPTPQTVVGPVCESSDVFAEARPLPPLREGDLVAILDTGAYGSVMSSTYNSRPFAAQAMVENGAWQPIRTRQPVEALWADETLPDWLRRVS
ncbi:diaminopimelate decarboxylase [Acidomonas methanolica]|uniref:diaminopimelate decarboxylase n=1 Tax=Acidomonas methanolica TaxID=437 RepID=UPI00211A599A|nr:diaminopimelate decarboxylase [Acidomonas methanolica]